MYKGVSVKDTSFFASENQSSVIIIIVTVVRGSIIGGIYNGCTYKKTV